MNVGKGLLIRLSKVLFAYQIFIVVRPQLALPWLVNRAVETRADRLSRALP